MDLLIFFGDAGKIALGALIGAVGGWIVARMNRNETRAARFEGTKRALLEWPDLTIRVVSRLATT